MSIIVLNVIKSTEQMTAQVKKVSIYHSFKKLLQLECVCEVVGVGSGGWGEALRSS